MFSKLYRDGIKRCIDLIVATIVLVLSSPMLVLIALAIRLDSPGPIFFKQNRTGRDGETFQIRKFRSMSKSNSVYDMTVTDQVTRVGYWLRRTSLDELPQMINVLRGEMSLIGPRPWIPDYYAVMNDDQRKRYSVRPGITGLAQATGRNALTIFEKIACDLEYVEKVSLRTDLAIVIRTLKTVGDASTLDIGKEGISREIHELSRSNGLGMVPSFDGTDEENMAPKRAVIAVTTDHAVQYHADLAKLMVENGWEVTFVSTGGPSLESLDLEIRVATIPMVRNPSPINDLKAVLLWIGFLRKAKPDLLIVGTPKASLLGMIAGWVTRVPVRVYWLHGLRLETATGKLRSLLTVFEQLTMRLATTTIAVSPSLRNRVGELKIAPSSELEVIGKGSTQGVDTAKFVPLNDSEEKRILKESWDLDPSLPVVGFLGRLTVDKGVKELTDALLVLHEKGIPFQALLVGPVEDSAGDNIQQELRRAGIKFEAPGRITDTARAYGAMDIFCLPSYREGLPNVVLEAFSCGLPVVATDITGNSDLIKNGENGLLVDARDSDSLRKSLEKLLLDDELKETLGSAARSTAEMDFSVGRVVTMQYDFLEKLYDEKN